MRLLIAAAVFIILLMGHLFLTNPLLIALVCLLSAALAFRKNSRLPLLPILLAELLIGVGFLVFFWSRESLSVYARNFNISSLLLVLFLLAVNTITILLCATASFRLAKGIRKLLPVFFLLPLLLAANALPAQSNSRIRQYLQLIRKEFNDSTAWQTTAFVGDRWRVPGNSDFNASIACVEKILQRAGFVEQTAGARETALSYRIDKRPMSERTWEPIQARLQLAGDDEPLLDLHTNRNMLAIHSASTPPEGIKAELVDVGYANEEDFKDKDVKGRIVYGRDYLDKVYANGIRHGAIGALAYFMPTYTKPAINKNSIQFQSIDDSDSTRWGIALSYAAKERIEKELAKGQTIIHVTIRTNRYSSAEQTLVANIQGIGRPNERMVMSAHVQEPGANDNASGVGTLAAVAQLLANLVQQHTIRPDRTLTFIWGNEYASVERYIKEDTIRAKDIKWGLSLDMVGESRDRTGAEFLIEKLPDPSAIWTRGNDRHSEWGGRALKEEQLFPHYFTDFLIDRCRDQGAGSDWIVHTNPYEGGSDHTPFLNAKIPGLLMWHFTDEFYHTDGDRIEKVSLPEMRNVGISCALAASVLVTADQDMTLFLVRQITNDALRRLETESALSRDTVLKGGDPQLQQHILDTWADWYIHAIAKMNELILPAAAGNPAAADVVARAIDRSKMEIGNKTAAYKKRLKQ